MIPKPTVQDVKTIGYYTAIILIGYGLLMVIPIIISFFLGEYNEGINCFIGLLITLIFGYTLRLLCQRHISTLSWIQGMVVTSLSWFLCMFFGAIPFTLSGHFLSYTDACFEGMSGLATVGLSLMQDLEHASYTLKMWRFLFPYIAGQGIILITMTLLVHTSGVYSMYVGEGREERILPNIVNTARIIWGISLTYFCIGTISLWLAGLGIGLSVGEAFWQGLWLYMSSWATCGFASQSSSILYYHSLTIEMMTITICFLGAINFSVHYSLISGNRKEVYRNIELITFTITFLIILFIIINGLSQQKVYSDLISFFRQAFYLLASAHTTTGHTTLFLPQFIEWGPVALIGLIIAMAIGGSSGSTSGAIKILRIGILFKGMIQDIKYLSLPKSGVMKGKFHHIKDIILEDRIVRSAMFVTLCYLFAYGLTTFLGVLYGYPLLNSMFDAVSAGSGTGLTSGVVSPQMPFLLKWFYILEMWAGRLEFMSIFALVSFIISMKKGIK